MANLATLGIQVNSNAPAAATGLNQLSGAATQAQAAINGTTSAAAKLNQQTTQMSYQFQDIGVQLVGGQSPFMILAQQLPQLTMHGGKLTGIIGGLKQTFAGFISPLGLVTTGLTLAAYAAIQYFSSSEDAAKAQADELEKQGELIRRVADEWGAATPQIAAYADELERVVSLNELREATGLTIAAQYEAADESLGKFIDSLNASSAELTIGNQEGMAFVDTMIALTDAASQLSAAQKDGSDSTDEMARVQMLVNQLMSNGTGVTAGLSSEVRKLGDDYLYAAEQAQAAADAQKLLESRGGVNVSEYGGGRGMDPRGSFKDEGGYYTDRYLPDPEKAARAARAPRASAAEREAERAVKNYADMIMSSQQYIEAQQQELQQLGMTTEAAAAFRYEQEMLNQAANDNIDLTARQREEIAGYAAGMAMAEEATRRAQEAIDFARDTTRGFIDDMRSGLEQGKGFWESFANAALNALDKITNKILDDLLEAMFQVNSATGGGGFLSSIISRIFGGGGGGGFSAASIAGIGQGLFDQGGYTGNGGKHQPAGIVHKGEYVFSAAATRAIGAKNLDRAHRSAKGYAEGGMVGGGAGMYGGAANSNVHVVVSVDDKGALQAYVQRTSAEIAQATTQEGLKRYDATAQPRFTRDARRAKMRGAI